ncbi:OmpA family protein [Temperatibacter marinus]|uniref:OmpA family protein n=1 Tax=Temperatibacter marinus TaxID=1456591 RepID=A0AA52EF89_9PROT|nr:OmpA family protein [Temperatibacter marinus]WND02578.1 OmpA family protein [Temperatibacter marinus]
MRRTFISLLTASCLVSPVVLADDKENFYVGGSINWLLDNTNHYGLTGGEKLSYTESDNGLDFSVFAGQRFNKIKAELEYFHISHGTDLIRLKGPAIAAAFNGLAVGNNTITGDATTNALMVNVWYELAESGSLSFDVGAGFGVAKTNLNTLGTSAGIFADSADWTTAYQMLAKVNYDLSDSVDMFVGYRYHKTNSSDQVSSNNTSFLAKATNHYLMAGLTYNFGMKTKKTVAEPVVAPTPAPEPKPVVEKVVTKPVAAKPLPKPALPATKEFIVFFDFDQATITETAAAILREAKLAFEKYEFVSIKTTGHTDSRGSNAYNNRLALKRVRAVQAALVEMGIQSNDIEIDAKGEADLLVNTGDNVREAQNRRVEITLKR